MSNLPGTLRWMSFKHPARNKFAKRLSYLMKDILFREVRDPDIRSLARIRARNRGTEEQWTSRIKGYLDGTVNPQQALAPRIIYVAHIDEIIVGFIGGHLTRRFDCEGELEWIDVVEEFRRKGIASQLIRLLAGWFIEQQAYKICIDPGNETARIFYGKNGAEQLNEHWMFWADIRNMS